MILRRQVPWRVWVVTLTIAWGCASACADAPKAERIFRPARYTRGNTGVFPLQPIDDAAWLTHPDDAEPGGTEIRVLRFARTFRSDGETLVFDVTADERFYLTIDRRFVARGPHRGTVQNWTYQSYRLPLEPGEHTVEATVWRLGAAAPLAQLSYRLGFCFKAEGAYDAALTTGKAAWRVCALEGLKSIGMAAGVMGVGEGFEMTGTGIYDRQGADWQEPTVIRRPVNAAHGVWGVRQDGWMLFPSELPDQTELRVRPGRFVAGAAMRFPLVVPARSKVTVLWDLDRYICAYPEAVVQGGRQGRISWRWAESLRGPSNDPKQPRPTKGDRRAWRGKTFDGFGDVFLADGREKAVFQPPWFRCGRWCELTVETEDEPLTIADLSLIESRYPLSCDSRFEAVGDSRLAPVQDICVRSMQMCAHEMLFDCPYYEQQMYPGDTRVQLNVLSAMSSDDALIRRAIDFFALNARDDGMVPFNFPTRGLQEGASYTLCYLGMYHDYLMNHANRAWLKARLPGVRGTLSGFEAYARADGLLEGLPGWSFLDWVPRPAWKGGWAPGSRQGGANAELNLFYLAALQGVAEIEETFGNGALAAHWRGKAERLRAAIVEVFFDDRRGLFASDGAHEVYSEHAQCLALLTDVFEGGRAQALFDRLVASSDLCPASVYFSYYLFEAYFKFARADLFLKRLDLWKGYIDLGATTCLEEPEYPGHDSRSDCHAWGAHPLWFLRTGVAGIRSAAPFYARVRIAPQPVGLTNIRTEYPHPSGRMIRLDVVFEEARVRGTVETPVPGTFVWKGNVVELTADHPVALDLRPRNVARLGGMPSADRVRP